MNTEIAAIMEKAIVKIGLTFDVTERELKLHAGRMAEEIANGVPAIKVAYSEVSQMGIYRHYMNGKPTRGDIYKLASVIKALRMGKHIPLLDEAKRPKASSIWSMLEVVVVD